MASIAELPKPVQYLGVVIVGILVTAGLYFVLFRGIAEQNKVIAGKLQARVAEVDALRKYENSLRDLETQIAALKQQLEIQKRIVPDEQEADQFMHILQNTAQDSGVEIRRWTAKPTAGREFYTEVPFELELDGPYDSVLKFFDRVARLERIINVSSLQLTGLRGAKGTTPGKYHYAIQESVTGTCTATTFFSSEHPPASPSGKAGGK
jgi:type IV pilus assembly protein PilO